MSRVGRKPIPLPKGVEVSQQENEVVVKGPKGSLRTKLIEGLSMKVENGSVVFDRANEERQTRAFHGLMRALVANNVAGVSEGFRRDLDIIGVGYRGEVKGREVVFQLGYSHPIHFKIPEGIDIAVDKSGRVTITGIDRQKVGQTAAEIRSLRLPDPYKGKGIKYTDEVIRRKAGKAAGK
ncbi:MAG TPA: 50S ribosomal protein L6 [Thermoanaerobaculia bacterium]|nr:50S ribosomal protein L6 [Thermoanaerobaculia bacterium]